MDSSTTDKQQILRGMAAWLVFLTQCLGLAVSSYVYPLKVFIPSTPFVHQAGFPYWFPHSSQGILGSQLHRNHFMANHHYQKKLWHNYHMRHHNMKYGMPSITGGVLGSQHAAMSPALRPLPYTASSVLRSPYYAEFDSKPDEIGYGLLGGRMAAPGVPRMFPGPVGAFGVSGVNRMSPMYSNSMPGYTRPAGVGLGQRRPAPPQGPPVRRVLSNRQNRGRPLPPRPFMDVRDRDYPRLSIPAAAQLKNLPDSLLKPDIKNGMIKPMDPKKGLMFDASGRPLPPPGIPPPSMIPNIDPSKLKSLHEKRLDFAKATDAMIDQTVLDMTTGVGGPMMDPGLKAMINDPLVHPDILVDRLNGPDTIGLSLAQDFGPQKEMIINGGPSSGPVPAAAPALDVAGPPMVFTKRRVNGADMYSMKNVDPGAKADMIGDIAFGSLNVPPSVSASANAQANMMMDQMANDAMLAADIAHLSKAGNEYLGKQEARLNMDLLGIQFPPGSSMDLAGAAAAAASGNPIMTDYAQDVRKQNIDLMKDILSNESMLPPSRLVGQNNIINRMNAGLGGGKGALKDNLSVKLQAFVDNHGVTRMLNDPAANCFDKELNMVIPCALS